MTYSWRDDGTLHCPISGTLGCKPDEPLLVIPLDAPIGQGLSVYVTEEDGQLRASISLFGRDYRHDGSCIHLEFVGRENSATLQEFFRALRYGAPKPVGRDEQL